VGSFSAFALVMNMEKSEKQPKAEKLIANLLMWHRKKKKTKGGEIHRTAGRNKLTFRSDSNITDHPFFPHSLHPFSSTPFGPSINSIKALYVNLNCRLYLYILLFGCSFLKYGF
jgi:hypothetical protein